MDILMALRKIRGCEGEIAAQLVLEYAIKEAVEAEREACAKLCEVMECRTYEQGTDNRRAWNEATIDCAKTIRMRSNVKVTGDGRLHGRRPSEPQG